MTLSKLKTSHTFTTNTDKKRYSENVKKSNLRYNNRAFSLGQIVVLYNNNRYYITSRNNNFYF